MKKIYFTPNVQTVRMQHHSVICAGSDPVQTLGGNAGLQNGGGSSNNTGGHVRSGEFVGTFWADEE